MDIEEATAGAGVPSLSAQELISLMSGDDPNITLEAIKRARQVFLHQKVDSKSMDTADATKSKPLVVEYLERSPEAAEFMRIWEGLGLASTARIHVAIVDILSIMISCAPLEAASILAKRIIRTRYKTLAAALSSDNVRLTRTALKMFSNIATISQSNSREVLRALNLQPKLTEKLLSTRHNSGEAKGRGKSDKKAAKAVLDAAGLAKHIYMHGHPDDDVRSNFMRLISALVRSPAADVVRETVKAKGLVAGIVKGLDKDAERVAVDILSAFGDSFVLGSHIPRKLLLSTFSTPVLADLVAVYDAVASVSVKRALHALLVPICTGRLLLEDVEMIEKYQQQQLYPMPQSAVDGVGADTAERAAAPPRKRRRAEEYTSSNAVQPAPHSVDPFLSFADYRQKVLSAQLPLFAPSVFIDRHTRGGHSFGHAAGDGSALAQPIFASFSAADDAPFDLKYAAGQAFDHDLDETALATQSRHTPKVLQFLCQIKSPEQPLVRDLILRILRAQSGIVPMYLTEFPYSLEPRSSHRWLANAALASQAILLTDRVCPADLQFHTAVSVAGEKSVETLCADYRFDSTMADALINAQVPRGTSRAALTRGLLNSNAFVCYTTLRIVDALLLRIQALMRYACRLTVDAKVTTEVASTIRSLIASSRALALCRAAASILPDFQSVLAIRSKLQDLVDGKSSLSLDLEVSADLAVPADLKGSLQPWRRPLQAQFLSTLRQFVEGLPSVVMPSAASGGASGFDFMKLVPSTASTLRGDATSADEMRQLCDVLLSLPSPSHRDVLEKWLSKARPVAAGAAPEDLIAEVLTESPLSTLILSLTRAQDFSSADTMAALIKRCLLACDDPSAPQAVAADADAPEESKARLFRSTLAVFGDQDGVKKGSIASEADLWLHALHKQCTDPVAMMGQSDPAAACSAILYGLVWCGAYDATPSPYASLQRMDLSVESLHGSIVNTISLAPFTLRAWYAFAAAIVQHFEDEAADHPSVAKSVAALSKAAGLIGLEEGVSLPTNTTRSIVAQQHANKLYKLLVSAPACAILVETTTRLLAALSDVEQAKFKAVMLSILKPTVDVLHTAVAHVGTDREANPSGAPIAEMLMMLTSLQLSKPQSPGKFPVLEALLAKSSGKSGRSKGEAGDATTPSKRKRVAESGEVAIGWLDKVAVSLAQDDLSDAGVFCMLALVHSQSPVALPTVARRLFTGTRNIFGNVVILRACSVDVDQDALKAVLRSSAKLCKDLQATFELDDSNKLSSDLKTLVAAVVEAMPPLELLTQATSTIGGWVPYSNPRVQRVVHGAIFRSCSSAKHIDDATSKLYVDASSDAAFDIAIVLHGLYRALSSSVDAPHYERLVWVYDALIRLLAEGEALVPRKDALDVRETSVDQVIPPARLRSLASRCALARLSSDSSLASFHAQLSHGTSDGIASVVSLFNHACQLLPYHKNAVLTKYIQAALAVGAKTIAPAHITFLSGVKSVLERKDLLQFLLLLTERCSHSADFNSIIKVLHEVCTMPAMQHDADLRRASFRTLLMALQAALQIADVDEEGVKQLVSLAMEKSNSMAADEVDSKVLSAVVDRYLEQPSSLMSMLVRELVRKHGLNVDVTSCKPVKSACKAIKSIVAGRGDGDEAADTHDSEAIMQALALLTVSESDADSYAHPERILQLCIFAAFYWRPTAGSKGFRSAVTASAAAIFAKLFSSGVSREMIVDSVKVWMKSWAPESAPHYSLAAARCLRLVSEELLTSDREFALLLLSLLAKQICAIHTYFLAPVPASTETWELNGAPAVLSLMHWAFTRLDARQWQKLCDSELYETALEDIKTMIRAAILPDSAPTEPSAMHFHLLSIPGVLQALTAAVKLLYAAEALPVKSSKSKKLSVANVHNAVTGHESFMHLFLRNKYQHIPGIHLEAGDSVTWLPARAAMAELLLTLTALDASGCISAKLLPVIASAYTASLSSGDMVLRTLLHLYEANDFSPASIGYTWSTSALRYIDWNDFGFAPHAGAPAWQQPALSFEWLFAAESAASSGAGAKDGKRGFKGRRAPTIAPNAFHGPLGARIFAQDLYAAQTGLLQQRVNATLGGYPVYRSIVNPSETCDDALTDAAAAMPYSNLSRVDVARNEEHLGACYDPSYILPCLLSLMSSARINPRRFVSSGALALALMALTSARESARKLGYAIVGSYFDLLQTPNVKATFKEQGQVSLVLSALRNAVTEPFERMPSMHVSFIVASLYVVMRPLHKLYALVNRYFLRTTTLDVSDIPMLYASFRSGDALSLAQQLWMLRLLSRSMQCGNDHAVLRRRHGYHLMMTLFNSPATPIEICRGIMHLLHSAAKLRILAAKSQVILASGDDDSDDSSSDDDDAPGAGEASTSDDSDSDNASSASDSDDSEGEVDLPAEAKRKMQAIVGTKDMSESDGARWEDYLSTVGLAAVRRHGKAASTADVTSDKYHVALGVATYLRKACAAVSWIAALWDSLSDTSIQGIVASAREDVQLSSIVVVRGAALSALPLDSLLLSAIILARLYQAAGLGERVQELLKTVHSDVHASCGCEVAEFKHAFSCIVSKCEAIASRIADSDGDAARTVSTVVHSLVLQPYGEILSELHKYERKLAARTR